jgi:hypothetical protein
VSLLATLRHVLIRVLEALKPRRPRTDPASSGSVWDAPLSGDAWIGVFLIGLSIVTVLVGLQHAY